MFTFICILFGILLVTITIVLLAISYWKYTVMKYARWLGFVASKCHAQSVMGACILYILENSAILV
jgi:uncharacterized membrane protein YidH (DUF202 family)